jgi:Ser-tRNA(Ala) deacylase AlaX
MKRIIRIKIDVTKIDKSALYKGAKGTYLDATLFLADEPGEYGDNGMIAQDLGKERREAGEKGAILGNGKILKIINEGQPAQASLPPAPDTSGDVEDDIPF